MNISMMILGLFVLLFTGITPCQSVGLDEIKVITSITQPSILGLEFMIPKNHRDSMDTVGDKRYVYLKVENLEIWYERDKLLSFAYVKLGQAKSTSTTVPGDYNLFFRITGQENDLTNPKRKVYVAKIQGDFTASQIGANDIIQVFVPVRGQAKIKSTKKGTSRNKSDNTVRN